MRTYSLDKKSMQEESRLLRSVRVFVFITVILKIGMMCDVYEATKKRRSNTLRVKFQLLISYGDT
jgi:hypothetical protein